MKPIISNIHSLPTNKFFRIPLSKNTLKLLTNNSIFMTTLNSLFAYYSGMLLNNELDHINKYMICRYPDFDKVIYFFKKYAEKKFRRL